MLGEVNPKLGFAICPFIKQYKSKIQTIRVKKLQHLKSHLHTVCGVINAVGMEAVVLYGHKCSFDTQAKIVHDFNQRYKKLNITILGMHPDSEDPPLPVEYNYYRPIIIVQRTQTLDDARKKLKRSKYYDNWVD